MNQAFKAAAAIILASSVSVQAQPDVNSRDYYTVKDRTVSIAQADTGGEAALEVPLLNPQPATKEAITAVVNTGIAAWNVISGGKPSGSATSAYASALPPSIYLNWSSVANWRGPREYIYTYTVTNLMNVDVIKVKYKISYYYGGTEDYTGRPQTADQVTGKYITNFTVKALEVKVLWGWHFDLDVKMSNPMNVGTPRNPVAFLQSDLNWAVSNVFSTDGGVWSYTVDGNGNFHDLDAENRAVTRTVPLPVAPETRQVSWN